MNKCKHKEFLEDYLDGLYCKGCGEYKSKIEATKEIKEIRRKYLQLGREIESGAAWSDMSHTHSKLGIFLESYFGYKIWRQDY